VTGLQRILATLAGEPVDRRALAPVLSLYGARLTDCPPDRYFESAEAYAHGQAAVREVFQPDVVFGPFAFAPLGAAFGSEVYYFADAAPNISRPAIDSVEAWGRVVVPDPDSHPALVYLREAIRLIAQREAGQAAVAAVLASPLDLPPLIMGLDAWMEAILFSTEAARRVASSLVPLFQRLANGLLAAGASFVVLPCAFASPAILTRDIVSSFSRPLLAETLAGIEGPVVLHHAGAPLLAHLDLITGLPPTAAFGLDPRDNLAKARAIVGPEPVLLGGPHGPGLAARTAAQIAADCRDFLEDRAPDPRFILATTGPDVPWRTPPENIRALQRAAEDFARATR
jgi:uroporphyrinogen decarboxylase